MDDSKSTVVEPDSEPPVATVLVSSEPKVGLQDSSAGGKSTVADDELPAGKVSSSGLYTVSSTTIASPHDAMLLQ
ncbi:MAG: hypothetical protein GY811_22370 [Myxococcales bacterium]|nr:hypothetical protein [Myxococcales bacterium]